MSSRVETPSPDRHNPVRIDRDVTPELKPSRVERNESERSGSSRSHRHTSRHEDDDEEDEEARRRRRRRERQRAEEEEDDDPEERRRRRSERRDGGERREKRDRSRNSSHRSSHSSKREETRDRPERESRDRDRADRDRADRDREMKAERRDREREREEYFEKLDRDRAAERHRSSPRRRRRHSPSYDGPRGGRDRDRDRDGDRDADGGADALLDEIDSEARSVFVSQLAARLTSRDLGMFFEDMLGDGSVRDARIVTDRISRRSKGIGYVELSDIELVEKALALTGTVVMGLQIKVELTEAERNKQQAATSTGPGGSMGGPTSGPGSLPPLQNLPPGQALPSGQYPPGQYPRPNINNPMFPVAQYQPGLGGPQGMPGGPGLPGMPARPPMPAQLHRDRFAGAEIPYHRLYVGSLNFDLTAEDIKQVFTPFGELEFVDLHRDPMTGKSKGFCFVQFLELESAKTALQTMNGFELAGRQLKVSTVNEKASKPPMGGANGGQNPGARYATGANGTGPGAMPESLEEHHGQRLDHATRQSLMMKLARQDPSDVSSPAPAATFRPSMPTQPSVFVLVSNVFNPAEETEQDWDIELAEDIKGEVESKYGPVLHIKVEKESQGEVYIHFDSLASSTAGVNGLNGRFFGGRSLVAQYISEPTFKAHT